MIPLELVGRIRENYRIHRSQSRCAKELNVHRATVHRYAVLNVDRNRPRPHVLAPAIAHRRACIHRLWRKVSQSGSRKWKTYGSATALGRALAAQDGIRVSTRTVQRDLHAMGLYARVRRPTPTRDRQELAAKRVYNFSCLGLYLRLGFHAHYTWTKGIEAESSSWSTHCSLAHTRSCTQ
jgi:hypothetical protein